MEERAYTVNGMTCDHCSAAVSKEVGQVAGVAEVNVDLEGKSLTVRGSGLDDAAIRAAVDEAGYEVAE